jgi:hypothetical protein
MIVSALCIIRLYDRGCFFQPSKLVWLFSVLATLILLYSFMRDTPATLHGQMPKPYGYWLLAVGDFLYLAALAIACRGSCKGKAV